jgi:hypothetical protein
VKRETEAADSPARWVWLSPIFAGIAAIALRLAVLTWLPIPVPTVHDEFSYLLGADTFSSGRVTNPTHPLWVHFETFHVNQKPTYCSMYPPGQALILGLGQRFFGHPWFGVCLSVGAMFAAIQWMLLGWFPVRYATLTTLLGLLGWGITSAWINSYWGGAVAATGGALVIGTLPRIIHRVRVVPILLGSAGLLILANSRPFEGLLTAVGCAVVCVLEMRRRRVRFRAILTAHALSAFLAVMIPGAALMAYYNYRVSGNALVLPYTVNQKAYAAAPVFYVMPPVKTPTYRHENLREYWIKWVLPQYLDARAAPLSLAGRSAFVMAVFYLFNPFALVFAMGLLFGWGPELRAALIILAVPLVGLLLADGVQPHYLAPAFGAFLMVGALGLQKIGRWQLAAPILLAGMIGVSAGWCGLMLRREVKESRHTPAGVATRPLLMQRLHQQGGRHVVIVRYSGNHDFHSEWVNNRANIDASEIVWAQDMGAAANSALLTYYRDRKIWLLEPDVDPLALTPYSPPE